MFPLVTILGIAGVILLAFATKIPAVQQLDDAIEERVGPHRLRWRRIAGVATLTGEKFVHPFIAMGSAALLIATRGGPAMRFLVPLGAASVGGITLHHIVKFIYHRHRPQVALDRDKTEAAYPSGHTTNATSVVLTSAYLLVHEGLLPANVAIAAALVLCLCTGASRVALGWHWSTDVLGGWMGGCAIAVAATHLYR